jgi:hypothetical protein
MRRLLKRLPYLDQKPVFLKESGGAAPGTKLYYAAAGTAKNLGPDRPAGEIKATLR